MRTSIRILIAALFGCASSAHAETGYYRAPSIHGETIVFTAEGDLWKVAASGGIAQRLTTHAAEESESRISPDGQWIAFSASYDSAIEAYVMPINGGAPKRLTFDGARVWVHGWTPQNEVLYASENVSGPFRRRVLRAVDPTSLKVRTLPLFDVNEATIGEDGRTLFFTRFGLQMTTDNARAYRGGAMSQLWKFALDGNAEATRLAADANAALSRPMWWNDRLYVVSDADGTQNVWSMRSDGSDRQQITHQDTFDVRGATLGDGRIVYQSGADLHRLDIASGEDVIVPINLVSDFEQRHARWLRNGSGFISDLAVSADGERAVLTARGKIVVAAPGALRRVDIDVPDAHRGRAAVLSADGQYVYAIADIDGKNEIWQFAADGSKERKQLTRDGGVHRWHLFPSPDGKWLAHDDKAGRLWLLDLASGDNRLLDSGPRIGDDVYSDIVWSPDGKYLALGRPDSQRQIGQLHLYDIATRKLHTLTSDRYESFAPAFSRDGHWLYFLSNRNFVATPGAPWGDRNMGPVFDRRTKIYAYALQTGTRFPFLQRNELQADADDEKKIADADKEKKESAEKSNTSDKPAIVLMPAVQWPGITERLYEVPMPAGNYTRLAVDDKRLYLLDTDVGADAKPKIRTLAIDDDAPEPATFAEGVQGFSLSADGKKVLFAKAGERGPGDIFIVDAGAKAPKDSSKQQVRLGDWILPLAPEQEWKQIFVDAWRMHRDFSFDPTMRGVDWNAVRARYEPLLARVTDRSELDDLLGQMTSELGILHSQVRGAEVRKDADAAVAASLGAELERVANGARIVHIYRTEPELPESRGPLQQAGVDARDGDVIVAVNGRSVGDVADIAELLQNQSGQQVLIELERAGRRLRNVVMPATMEEEANLRYSDWVQRTRDNVQSVGDGRIGYLHLRAMGAADIASFARDFYASYDRDGLIIDVRRNRGGNIDSWVIEKLLRRTWAFWQSANTEPSWNMQQGFRGHIAVLTDPFTYSDGETFSAGIKALGIAPLIGQRTAGAGIWLSDRNRLSDNGIARVAENGQFRADGQWLIEGRGVGPDIEVENLPFESFNGRDRQLEAAIAYLDKKLTDEPIQKPKAQPIPARGTPAQDVR